MFSPAALHPDRAGRRRRHLVLAAEGSAGYATVPVGEAPHVGQAGDVGQAGERRGPGAAGLLAAVEQVQAVPVGDLLDDEVRAEIGLLEEVRRRIDARLARLAAEYGHRRARQVAKERPNDPLAGQKGAREAQAELVDDFQWTPSQAKNAERLGRTIDRHPGVAGAMDAGRLSPRHAAKLSETLGYLADYFERCPDQREAIERRLIEAAETENATTFAKTCRRVLAETDHDAAMVEMGHARKRRYVRMTDTEDGMTVLSGQWTGTDALLIKTAHKAFMRPDAKGERRTPEQRAADVWVAIAQAALDAGLGSRNQRPHVVVHIDYTDLMSQAGVAETLEGPLPYGEVRRLLADCGVSRMLIDPNGIAVEAGQAVRNVPIGLWRFLLSRDAGCVFKGCDMPAQWCQAMHLEDPYRFGGRLTPKNSALGCIYHHQEFDRGRLRLVWEGEKPKLVRPALPDPPDPPDDGDRHSGDRSERSDRSDPPDAGRRSPPADAGDRSNPRVVVVPPG